jgi:putative transposase
LWVRQIFDLVAMRESAELAERLIQDSCTKQRILPGQLTLHADRGTSTPR